MKLEYLSRFQMLFSWRTSPASPITVPQPRRNLPKIDPGPGDGG